MQTTPAHPETPTGADDPRCIPHKLTAPLPVGAECPYPAYTADDAYVARRHESATLPGAWEAIAAARFRRPGSQLPAAASSARRYDRITVPVLVVEGGADKLLPAGWAAEIAGQIAGARSAVVENAGHCPQIEQPDAVTTLLLDFFAEQSERA